MPIPMGCCKKARKSFSRRGAVGKGRGVWRRTSPRSRTRERSGAPLNSVILTTTITIIIISIIIIIGFFGFLKKPLGYFENRSVIKKPLGFLEAFSVRCGKRGYRCGFVCQTTDGTVSNVVRLLISSRPPFLQKLHRHRKKTKSFPTGQAEKCHTPWERFLVEVGVSAPRSYLPPFPRSFSSKMSDLYGFLVNSSDLNIEKNGKIV